MNITFGTTEMQTLNDLQEIAKKHGMNIIFGFNSNSNTDIDYYILEKNNVDSGVISLIKENYINTYNINFKYNKICFELQDNKNNKYHTMSYIDSYLQFTAECDSDNIDDNDYFPLEEFMSNGDYFSFSYSPTIINGFGNKESVTDFRVYRSGMALKLFGDLVCDFLGEPRIERVY